MSLKEQQDLLARLYTDPHFARTFFDESCPGIASSGLSIEEVKDIAASAADDVRLFADSLVWKRLREVEKLLPVTRKMVGDFQQRFRAHAATFNPTSVKKHLEDAKKFGDRLVGNETIDPILKDVVRFETAKLRHFADGRQLTVCLLRHDVRQLFQPQRNVPEKDIGKRRSVAVWIRFRKRTRFFFI